MVTLKANGFRCSPARERIVASLGIFISDRAGNYVALNCAPRAWRPFAVPSAGSARPADSEEP